MLGFTSAIAAYGAFFIPKSFGSSVMTENDLRLQKSKAEGSASVLLADERIGGEHGTGASGRRAGIATSAAMDALQ